MLPPSTLPRGLLTALMAEATKGGRYTVTLSSDFAYGVEGRTGEPRGAEQAVLVSCQPAGSCMHVCVHASNETCKQSVCTGAHGCAWARAAVCAHAWLGPASLPPHAPQTHPHALTPSCVPDLQVPPNASVVFDLELVDWNTVTDRYLDGSVVIKSFGQTIDVSENC